MTCLSIALALAGPAAANEPPDSSTLGLERSGPDGPCAGAFEIRAPNGAIGCTHGPDPVPVGVDIHSPRTLAEMRAELFGPGDGTFQGTSGPSTIPCVGYGSSGKRVEAIYAYRAGDPSRYADVAPLISGWVAEIDAIFDASAAQTSGSRHMRWLHNTACRPTVTQVALSPDAAGTPSAAADIGQMMGEMINAGFNRPDRRYLVWVDVSTFESGICGIAVNITDDSPDQGNLNNGAPTGLSHFGRIDNDCWGVPAPETLVEAHEIMHTIGAVQYSSPYSSSVSQFEIYGHCIDEYEIMCYDDGSPKQLFERCPISNERFFDCGHDDYYHTAPPGGSYLATHWNTARSAFLVPLDPVGGFLDVDTSIFKGDIGWIQGEGITTGCTVDGEAYCPDNVVTRGQMASFLARALNLPATGTDFFTDDETSIHEADINRVAAAHIAAGCGSSGYCPDAFVSREQMASFLARALSLPATSADFFTDDETSIHEADINRVAAASVTTGCAAGRYCPTLFVTRGQMAAFLHRAFG